jgi:ice-binding like protein/exosortase sorting signal-containing protein
MEFRYRVNAACFGMALLCTVLPAAAQSLGAASSFAVEGFAGVTAAGAAGTVIAGDVGSSPSASITGFPPALVTPPFGLHPNDAAAIAAQAADVALFTSLGAGACADTLLPQMNGANIGPGIHCFSSTADLAALGTMTLTGAGTYIFRVPTSLTANVGSTVVLAGADPCSVFWQVGSAATLNGVNFPGNVVAQAGVTLGVGSTLTGRALATAGPVTLSGGNTVGGCSTAAVLPPSGAPPTLTKSFSPASIVAGATSTLTITLLNPNTSAATLTAPFVDTLPSGVVVAPVPNASTTCPGTGAVVAAAGASTVTLPVTRSIPAGAGSTPGSCTVTVDVTSNTAGTSINVIAAGALQTSNGANALAAQAALAITAAVVVPPPQQIPTLSEWAMILLVLLLATVAFAAMRRRR